jgi:hypothetical protein
MSSRMFFYEDRARPKKKAGLKSLNFLCLAKRDIGSLWQWLGQRF